jgi:protein-arginine kinase activator protein McsA
MVELFLEFLVFIGFRKRKKNITLGSKVQDESVCAGCHRRLKKQIIYEWGKMWCKDCYKTDVLKIII